MEHVISLDTQSSLICCV